MADTGRIAPVDRRSFERELFAMAGAAVARAVASSTSVLANRSATDHLARLSWPASGEDLAEVALLPEIAGAKMCRASWSILLKVTVHVKEQRQQEDHAKLVG